MNSSRTIGRRGALRLAGGLAGLGVAALGGPALAQQPGGMGGMSGPGGMQGGPMGGASGGMMGGTPGMMQGMQGMMAMMGGLLGPESDRLFIREMIPHHQGAVAMATAAAERAEHPEVKQLAETIIRTQNWEVEHMAALYRDWFKAPAVPPGEMPMMMAQMGMTAEALRGARPTDKVFLEMMSHHHHMAVMMASAALTNAQHDELARLQQKMIEDQAREIAQMRAWRRAWYPA